MFIKEFIILRFVGTMGNKNGISAIIIFMAIYTTDTKALITNRNKSFNEHLNILF